jgi:hypothetical protein
MGDALDAVLRREVERITSRTGKSGAQKQQQQPLPEWAQALVIPAPEDPDGFVAPDYLLRAEDALPKTTTMGSAAARPERRYARLDSSRTLSTLLRGARFVEFPTIDVWPAGAFRGVLIDASGRATHVGGDEEELVRAAKRRKLNGREGRRVIQGLVSGYGSSAEEDEGAEAEEKGTLAVLADYEGSDGEGALDEGVNEAAAAAEEEEAETGRHRGLDPVGSAEEEEEMVVESGLEEDGAEEVDYRALLNSLPLAEAVDFDALSSSSSDEGGEEVDRELKWGANDAAEDELREENGERVG